MRSEASKRRAPDHVAPAGPSISATEAQNNFGRVLGRAKRDGRVFITRYDQPEAVVLSIEEYDALTGRVPVDLEALEREFDQMLLRMQRPEHGRAVDQLFQMTGSQLGEAAARAQVASGSGADQPRLSAKPATRGQERASRRS